MTQQDILAKLGLSESEQKAYITLLAMGQLSEGELAKFSKLNVREVTEILSKLKEKGLTHEIHGITAKWVASYPFKGMSESVAHLRTDLKALSSDLAAVLKSRVTEYKSYSEQTRKEMEESLDRTKRSLKISTDTMKEDFEKFTGSVLEKS
ncbi:MAG: helix-turn-helix domain-containing protein, partial [Candidatus Hodarchaeota archaeon]